MDFLKLEKYTLIFILKEWLTLSDLTMMDSAFCNTLGRIQFLQLVSSESISFHGNDSAFLCSNLLKWLNTRSVNIDRMIINNNSLDMVFSLQLLSLVKSIKFEGSWAINYEILCTIITSTNALNSITLTNNDICVDKIIHHIVEMCKSLCLIDFSKTHLLKPESVISLSETNRYLTSVDVSSCLLVADDCVVSLVTNCKSLSFIRLDHCVKITGVSVIAIAENCEQLKSLSLNSCFRVTAPSVHLLVRKCSQLLELNLSRCDRVLTDRNMDDIATHCKGLTTLDISHSYSLSDRGIETICLGCRELVSLRVNNLFKVTTAAFYLIAQNLMHLEHIEFIQDTVINNHAFEVLVDAFQSVTFLDLHNGVIKGSRKADGMIHSGAVHVTDKLDASIEDSSILQALPCCHNALHTFVCNRYLQSDQTLRALLFHCPTMRVLDLSHLYFPSELKYLSVVAQCCTQLREFTSRHTPRNDSAQLIKIIKSNPNLVLFDIAYTGAENEVVHALARHCPVLQHLSIDLSFLTESVVEECVLGRFRRLQYLHLGQTYVPSQDRRMSWNHADALFEQCELLHVLILHGKKFEKNNPLNYDYEMY